jgi:hypothetical protein
LKFQPHEYYNCEVILDNSRHYRIEGNWLHNQGLDHWCGWSCEAGYSRLYINTDNEVYSGQCLNDYLGNLNTEWKLLLKPTTCFQQHCTGCTDDLIVAKKEGNNER